MAKRLESVNFRSAENGSIVSIHTVDDSADDMDRWETEERVFLEGQKAEMKEFIADKVDELT